MALYTLKTLNIFPEGTTVFAYSAIRQTPSGGPVGDSIDQQVVAAGQVTFSGLSLGSAYVAFGMVGGDWHRRGFQLDPPPSTAATLADVAEEQAAREEAIALLAAQIPTNIVDADTLNAAIAQALATNNFDRDLLLEGKADVADITALALTESLHEAQRAGVNPVHGIPNTFTDTQTWAWDAATGKMIPHDLGTPASPPATDFGMWDILDPAATLITVPVFLDNNIGDGKQRDGPTTLVDGIPGVSIKVANGMIITGGTCLLTFYSGATPIPGGQWVASNNGFPVYGRLGSPGLWTAPGDPLILNCIVATDAASFGSQKAGSTKGKFPAPVVGGHLSCYAE